MTPDEIRHLLTDAEKSGKLLDSSASNITAWLDENFLPEWALDSIGELLGKKAYEELNDRFFRFLAFGTGGMRGRTMGKVSAKAETGTLSEFGTPEHAAIGANYMNDLNVARATIGLFNYCKTQTAGAPKLVVANDVRHFSEHFCKLCASVWRKMGGEVWIFRAPRSTPQLSFTVRYLKTTAGIVITASHNPAHDNGYKVYFSDGAQAISPHAEGIVGEVNKVDWKTVGKFLNVDLDGVNFVGEDAETAYIKSLENSVIDSNLISAHTPKLVYTAVHGTGAALCPKVMRHFGIEPVLVESQMNFDPRFPTVKQPNPEYAETLTLGIEALKKSGADCLMATDPDADRMGVAVPSKDGGVKLLTGNMIGALLADYRITQMKAKGIITKPANCALIKTFVTTPLQDAIAKFHSVKCINCLTGFKWIGGKLEKYERKLSAALGRNASEIPYLEKAALMQEHSTFFVLGDEESYGFLGTDFTRDKDANAAVVMFSEMLAWLQSRGMTVEEYLDEIYVKCGYYLEDLKSIYREGAEGAAEIQAFLQKLDDSPLAAVGGVKVAKAVNFAKDEIYDADGDRIPREKFFFYTLENGYSFAIRASGTEPKIKFYAFAHESVADKSQLRAAKDDARRNLSAMLEALEKIFTESISA